MSTTHQALSQAQRVLHRVGEDLTNERRRLQLWASMLKRTTVSERAVAWARQHGFDLQVEAIAQRDTDSRRALADAQELYALAEAQASAIINQEEDLAVRARQVNQREWEVEKLEGLLQEREELDDITLRRQLEALSTRETSLDHREADLEREHKALEDTRAQILAWELDADARDTGLRDQEA
jgi:regulator of protease activity HflC (stomatin/prohibitin superfamily)